MNERAKETALAVVDTPQAVQRTPMGAEGMTFGDMLHMGEELVRTGFLPPNIRTGGQAAAIILTGRELGMQPMRAIRSLQMVKGKVVEDAASQFSRYKSQGHAGT